MSDRISFESMYNDGFSDGYSAALEEMRDSKQNPKAGQVDAIVTGTPISDKNNLSLKSNGDEDFERWIYEISILLDKIIPVHGYTNAQRIEMAINEIKRQCQ